MTNRELWFEMARVWDKYDCDPSTTTARETMELVNKHNPGDEIDLASVKKAQPKAVEEWKTHFAWHVSVVEARRAR